MEKTVEENSISSKRLAYSIGVFVLFLFGEAGLCLGQEMLLDRLFCLCIIDIVFCLVFVLALLKHRLSGKLPQKHSANYKKVFLSFVLAWCVILLGMFCPACFAPMLLVGVFLYPSMEEGLAIGGGMVMLLLYSITRSSSLYEVVCYGLLLICGVLLADYLKEKQKDILLGIHVIYFLLGFLLPVIFYYLANHTITMKQVLFGLGDGILYSLLLVTVVPWFLQRNQLELEKSYTLFLKDTYPLVQDIRHYSLAEYNHGKRVSRLAGVCADEIGANVPCAMMAGFYYRLGKMEGEPEIDNALRLANNHCFPMDVMAIMEEYGGILRLPQTPESAIVHMVDALVTKIELLDQDTMSSTWNQDMVIYQTLNELSQNGMYDEAGISINQFLHIREKLVREDSLL